MKKFLVVVGCLALVACGGPSPPQEGDVEKRIYECNMVWQPSGKTGFMRRDCKWRVIETTVGDERE